MLLTRTQSLGAVSCRTPIVGAHAVTGVRSFRQVRRRRVVTVYAEDEPSPSQTTTTPDDDPLWVRREKQRAFEAQKGKKDLPWPLYLVASVIISIAAVGSIFEYADKNPIFGVIPPESPLWAPILGLFALSGLPTAGFLFFKGVKAANEAAEAQDRMDGYID